jgi:Homeobox KN domain
MSSRSDAGQQHYLPSGASTPAVEMHAHTSSAAHSFAIIPDMSSLAGPASLDSAGSDVGGNTSRVDFINDYGELIGEFERRGDALATVVDNACADLVAKSKIPDVVDLFAEMGDQVEVVDGEQHGGGAFGLADLSEDDDDYDEEEDAFGDGPAPDAAAMEFGNQVSMGGNKSTANLRANGTASRLQDARPNANNLARRDLTEEDRLQREVRRSFAMAMTALQEDNVPKKRRGNLPKDATDHFKAWFDCHLAHPYPSETEKKVLAHATNTTVDQVRFAYFSLAKSLSLQLVLVSILVIRVHDSLTCSRTAAIFPLFLLRNACLRVRVTRLKSLSCFQQQK